MLSTALLLTAAPLLVRNAEDELARTLLVPEGLEVTLWAESPALFNPTAIDVDARGRIWVVEGVNYRKWGGRNPGREHPEGERVVILEDTDGDGVCDASRVFVQDADLTSPLGIAVIDERVYVSCSPNLFVYVDEDGDDVPERRETFLTGFGGFDHDHGLHSLVAGPDGRFLVAAGNAGPHIVRDAAGWTLRSGSMYRGGGPSVADNKPGLVSDDGRVWTGGLALAVGQDGTGLEVLAHNFRNQYEVAPDSYGDLFTSDNDDDGNRSCRTLWCLQGASYGFFSADGSRTWQADRRPGQSTQTAHWHQDDPGVAPAGTINGAGGPTGVAVYEGELLRRWCDGAVLNADAGAGVVYAHLPRVVGAAIELERTDLLKGAPGDDGRGARWFRPSDVCVGLNGEVYVADWFDPGVGGHAMGDREAYGRILRVAPKGYRVPTRAVPAGSELERALELLRSPALHVRESGRRALARGGDEARALLGEAFRAEDDPRLRARIVWVALLALRDVGVVLDALTGEHGDERLRVTALRALRQAVGDADFLMTIQDFDLARDPSPQLRREILGSLRGVPLEDCLELLLDLAEGYDGRDRAYLEAFGLVADEHGEALYAELAAALGDTPGRWDARFEGLAWRLHAEAALDAFHARALDVSLTQDQRRRALDAIAFMPSRAAAEAMLTLATGGPEDLRAHARFWAEHRSGNLWRAYDLALQPDSDFERARPAFKSDVVRSGLIDVEVELNGAKTLWLVVDATEDGNSCDWADWVEPRFEGPRGTTRLTELTWSEAWAEWGQVNVGGNAVGQPMRVGEVAVTDGLGTHASSRIAYAVPPGATRFVARAGPDLGGTSQGGGAATSMRFEVRLEEPEGPPPSLAWIASLEDPATSDEERLEALRALALDPAGALRLCRRAAEGRLSPGEITIVADSIFQNPDLSVRALASEHFRRPGEDERAFPPIAELARLEGHPRRGQELFFDARAACSSCHVIARDGVPRGGEIGPDLTLVRQKYGVPELFDAILNPSAAIAFGYDSWIIEDKGGLMVSGFLLADGADLVVKDSRGLRHVIPAGEVAGRYKQTLSTMPEGVAMGLEPGELADLVAFLAEDPAAPLEAGDELELFNGRDLGGWTPHLSDPDADPADVWSVADGVLLCEGNPVGYLRTDATYENFELGLEWRFDPARGAGNSGVLLRLVGADKVWPKSIEAQLHSRNAGDIWNIDAVDMEVDPARTSGRRTTRMQPSSEKPLGAWNRYDIRLDRGTLELRVNGVLQNTAAWCERVPGHIALQSEGAPIQFKNIRLRPLR